MLVSVAAGWLEGGVVRQHLGKVVTAFYKEFGEVIHGLEVCAQAGFSQI